MESREGGPADGEEETNYYKENIFNKEDYYLYRAVMYFYAGEYERAINDFEKSSSIMHAQKVLYPRNQFPDIGDKDGLDGNFVGERNGGDDEAGSQDSS